MPERNLTAVGEATRPHGVKGEMRLRSWASSPALYASLKRVFLGRDQATAREYEIVSVRPHQDALLLTLKGVADRDAAERLRGMQLFAAAEDLPPLDEDEVYLHELEGLRVFLPLPEDEANPDRRPYLGTIRGFLEAGGQEIWSIVTDDGREILFPADPSLVLDIDLDAGEAVIDPPPGLVELYLKPESSEA